MTRAGDRVIVGSAVSADAPILPALAEAFRDVLEERLAAFAAYGSSVDGSFIPAFSDLDLILFLRGEFSSADAIAVQRGLGELQPEPFGYVQAKFVDVQKPPLPVLVAGSFWFLSGELPSERYLHDDDSLREASERWLKSLSNILAEDTAAWSVAVGSERRQRLLRLFMTRLKPTVRALLTARGEPPSATWLAGWDELVSRWGSYDEAGARQLAAVLRGLPPADRDGELACGATILCLVERITR